MLSLNEEAVFLMLLDGYDGYDGGGGEDRIA